jgi:cation:H+ antiporter
MAIVAGNELLFSGAQTLIARFEIAELPFDMTVLAFLVSIEELEREIPAARQGRPDISFSNVLGSILVFFLCDAGVIALVRPVPVDTTVLTFYLPLAFITKAMVSGVMLMKRVPHWKHPHPAVCGLCPRWMVQVGAHGRLHCPTGVRK